MERVVGQCSLIDTVVQDMDRKAGPHFFEFP